MIHHRILLAVSALWAVSLASQGAEPVAALRLKPEVTVRTTKLILGQIVEVESSDEDVARAVRGIVLGNAPAPGHVRMVGADTIKIRLIYAGIDPSLVELKGKFVKVRTESQRITSQKLMDLAVDYAKKLIPYPPQDVDISVLRTPRDEIVPVSDQVVTFHVSQQGGGKPWGKTQFIVRGSMGNTMLFRASVVLDIHVFGQIAVALTDIGRGETFTRENVGLKRTDVTSAPAGVDSIRAFIGKKAGSSIRSFTPLSTRMLARQGPVMKRGDIVVLVVEKGALRIVAHAQAVEDGRIGQTVRVRNTSSNRVAFGKVVDARTVRVLF